VIWASLNCCRRTHASPDPEAGRPAATFSVVRPTAERLVSVLQNISGPEELGVEFGLGFSAKAGVFFASVDSNVTFKISLKWKAGEKSSLKDTSDETGDKNESKEASDRGELRP
jgi:hypothetical protein